MNDGKTPPRLVGGVTNDDERMGSLDEMIGEVWTGVAEEDEKLNSPAVDWASGGFGSREEPGRWASPRAN